MQKTECGDLSELREEYTMLYTNSRYQQSAYNYNIILVLYTYRLRLDVHFEGAWLYCVHGARLCEGAYMHNATGIPVYTYESKL